MTIKEYVKDRKLVMFCTVSVLSVYSVTARLTRSGCSDQPRLSPQQWAGREQQEYRECDLPGGGALAPESAESAPDKLQRDGGRAMGGFQVAIQTSSWVKRSLVKVNTGGPWSRWEHRGGSRRLWNSVHVWTKVSHQGAFVTSRDHMGVSLQ